MIATESLKQASESHRQVEAGQTGRNLASLGSPDARFDFASKCEATLATSRRTSYALAFLVLPFITTDLGGGSIRLTTSPGSHRIDQKTLTRSRSLHTRDKLGRSSRAHKSRLSLRVLHPRPQRFCRPHGCEVARPCSTNEKSLRVRGQPLRGPLSATPGGRMKCQYESGVCAITTLKVADIRRRPLRTPRQVSACTLPPACVKNNKPYHKSDSNHITHTQPTRQHTVTLTLTLTFDI